MFSHAAHLAIKIIPRKHNFIVDRNITTRYKWVIKEGDGQMTKPIHITTDNRDAIEAALKAANGRADTFAITCYIDVAYIAERAEKALVALPQAQRVGARCSYIPEGPTARAYKYAAKSTRIEIERKRGGWFLAGVEATEVHPKSGEKFQMQVSREQRDEIARRAVANFALISEAVA